MKIFKKERILVFLLVLIGIALRIIIAKETQLYRDEVYDFDSARIYSFKDIVLYKYWDIFHPPLYFLFLKIWLLVGNTPFILRLPGVIASGLVLFLIPILARKILPHSNIFPFVFLFFFAFSRTQASIGVMVRQYSFEILFMVLSLIVFLTIINKKHSMHKNAYAIFTVVNILVFFGDYSGLWLIGSYFLFIFIGFLTKIIERKALESLLNSLLVSTSFFLLWASVFFIKELPEALKVVHGGFEKNGFSAFQALLFNMPFFTGASFSDVPLVYGITKSIIQWSFALFIFSMVGFFFLYKKEQKNFLFFLVMATAPIVVSLSVSMLFFKIFIDRNLIIVNIALIVGLAIFTAYLIENRLRIFQIIGFSFLMLWGINFLADFPRLHYVETYNWQGIARALHTASKGKSLYILSFSPQYMYYPIFYYDSVLKQDTVYRVVEYGDNFSKPVKGERIIFMGFATESLPKIQINKDSIKNIAKELDCILESEIASPVFYLGVCKVD